MMAPRSTLDSASQPGEVVGAITMVELGPPHNNPRGNLTMALLEGPGDDPLYPYPIQAKIPNGGYSIDRGRCGWRVSPRASISTNCSIRFARVSSFFVVESR